MPRRRTPLRAPSPPSLRLRLSPARSADSVALDGREAGRGEEKFALPQYVPWRKFYAEFNDEWTWGNPPHQQGEHVTLVGTIGSGKTTLARQLLALRDYVIVLATKEYDPSLYDPLKKQGYYQTSKVSDLDAAQHPKIIFKPPLESPTAAARTRQRDAFQELLIAIFQMRHWTLYADEVRYITGHLGLRTEMETLWEQGRSAGISIVAATQRPVSVPRLAFDQANHLFLWKNAERDNVDRMSEFTGILRNQVRYTIPRLPRHEALYVNTITDRVLRTRVAL